MLVLNSCGTYSGLPLCPLMFNTHMDMATHITKTCSTVFFYLYNICHIRSYLTRECTAKLIHAFITSRLDYCNSLLFGAPDYHIRKLQRVMNASARLIYCAHKYCHITLILKELHWLPVRSRIVFKILLITFKILQGRSNSQTPCRFNNRVASHYNLRRNNKGVLLSTPTRVTTATMGDRSFEVAAPSLWN